MKFKKFLWCLADYLFFIILGVGIGLIPLFLFPENRISIATVAVIPMILLRPSFEDFLDRKYPDEISDEIRELHETVKKRYQEKMQLTEEAKALLSGPYIYSFMRDFEQVVFDFSFYGKAGNLTHGTFTRVMKLDFPYEMEKQEESLRFINEITLLAEKNKHLIFAGCILAPVKKTVSIFLYYEPKHYHSVHKKIQKLFAKKKREAPVTATERDPHWETYKNRLLPPPNELWYLLNIRASAYMEYAGYDLSEETDAVIFMTFPSEKRDFLTQTEQYGFSLFHQSKKENVCTFVLTRKMRFDTESLDRMTDFLLHIADFYGGSFDEYEIFTDDIRKDISENGI